MSRAEYMDRIIAKEESSIDVFQRAKALADYNVSLLITGESGTGKDVLSRYIHENSCRRKKAFVHINCNTIPDSLFSSEFFGYASGSFTGASGRGKSGFVEVANGGTLFIDEVGDLSPENQVKLLQFTNDQHFYRVGENRSRTADVRMIFATNVDLKKAIHEGTFREDLYYRISGVTFELLPLRERKKDLEALLERFCKEAQDSFHISKTFSADAVEFLKVQVWPGNIRELYHLIQKIYIVEPEEVITAKLLSGYLPDFVDPSSEKQASMEKSQEGNRSLREAVAAFEQSYISECLQSSATRTEAAEKLGITRAALYNKCRKYGLLESIKP